MAFGHPAITVSPMRTPLSATVRWPSTIISRPHAEAPRSFQIVPMSDTRGAAAALGFSEVSAVELARQDRLPPVAWHSVELCDARIQLSVASAAVCGPDVDRLLASTFSFAPEVVHADMRRHLQMFAVCAAEQGGVSDATPLTARLHVSNGVAGACSRLQCAAAIIRHQLVCSHRLAVRAAQLRCGRTPLELRLPRSGDAPPARSRCQPRHARRPATAAQPARLATVGAAAAVGVDRLQHPRSRSLGSRARRRRGRRDPHEGLTLASWPTPFNIGGEFASSGAGASPLAAGRGGRRWRGAHRRVGTPRALYNRLFWVILCVLRTQSVCRASDHV